jgi:hypothetical protein
VGRAHKDPTTAQRVAVWSRSGGRCEVPHCGGAMRHIHHVWWWSKGGPTDIDYLLGVCRRCHTLIHNEHLTVTALGGQQFAFAIKEGAPITPNPETAVVERTIEELNHAAGVGCDATTCASSGENEPFDLRYVVDTLFDGLTYREQQRASN